MTNWDQFRQYQCRLCSDGCINPASSELSQRDLCRHCNYSAASSTTIEVAD